MDNSNQSPVRTINDFAAMMQIIGNLFYRNPNTASLASLYEIIFNGKIQSIWPLKQEALFKRLEKADLHNLSGEYFRLFEAQDAPVLLDISSLFVDDELKAITTQINDMIKEANMPINAETKITHYGFLWLLLSWIEAKREAELASTDSTSAIDENNYLQALNTSQDILFFEILTPLSKKLLGKIETFSQNDFYKVLAMITREVMDEVEIELTSNDTQA